MPMNDVLSKILNIDPTGTYQIDISPFKEYDVFQDRSKTSVDNWLELVATKVETTGIRHSLNVAEDATLICYVEEQEDDTAKIEMRNPTRWENEFIIHLLKEQGVDFSYWTNGDAFARLDDEKINSVITPDLFYANIIGETVQFVPLYAQLFGCTPSTDVLNKDLGAILPDFLTKNGDVWVDNDPKNSTTLEERIQQNGFVVHAQ